MVSVGTNNESGDRGAAGRHGGAPSWAEALERRVLLAADLSAKLGPTLAAAHASYVEFAAATAGSVGPRVFKLSPAAVPNAGTLRIDGTSVEVRAVAKGATATLLGRQLTAAGATLTGQYGRVVTARVPLGALPGVAAAADLNFARPAPAPFTRAGLVDDQA
ncbi:MAG: hypothetical protein JWO31_3743, partial [Phycisphaerales bacterium]|nr:hypothetical protein [Phycisphaerales bacterium]